jgi:hypothetical protein
MQTQMKKMLIVILLLFTGVVSGFSQFHTVEGKILDQQSKPITNANVFIKGTIDGATSDSLGNFSFTTSQKGEITLCARMLGYAEFTVQVSEKKSINLVLKMRPDNITLDNVVVSAGNFRLKGNDQFGKMSAVDIVTTAGSTGDLYHSLRTLPGAQMVGESGKLFIRGGDSNESQTYIDEMHVLSPYTITGENIPVRGRYSPFMFEGINFSTGGCSSEYAQGLSSVLALNTKDVSPITKTGVNVSSVGMSGGGTQAFDKGSVSASLEYQNMKPYYSLIPDRLNWINPYQLLSGSSQIRFKPNQSTVFKTFIGYNRTTFIQQLTSLENKTVRNLGMKDDNFYLNSTFQKTTKLGYKIFAGAAFSFKNQYIDDAVVATDSYRDREWEVHLKTKASKRFNDFLRLNIGLENFFRHDETAYSYSSIVHSDSINHSISALFATAVLNINPNLYAELSDRIEYTSINNLWNSNPRLALTYNLSGVHFSGIIGKYTQLPENKYLFLNKNLLTEECTQYVSGMYYEKRDKVYRIETYYKKYNDLALQEPAVLSSDGYGYSKGVDMFFNDRALFKNFEYMLAYSFNLSKRKYQDYTELSTPQYSTMHNATVSIKYNIPGVRSILGITNRFASGRPYHDPTKDGIMNSITGFYNSVDMSLTFLASKQVIIYASASNLLGRQNVYNYTYTADSTMPGGYRKTPVIDSTNHFFYIGIFITLSGKTAYDVSNF